MTRKYNYQKKLDNLEDLRLNTALLVLQEAIFDWAKKKPNNEKLIEVKDSLVEVSLLSTKLIVDKGTVHLALEDYRTKELRALRRARKAEEKVEELEKELNILRKRQDLGL